MFVGVPIALLAPLLYQGVNRYVRTLSRRSMPSDLGVSLLPTDHDHDSGLETEHNNWFDTRERAPTEWYDIDAEHPAGEMEGLGRMRAETSTEWFEVSSM